MAGVLFLPRQTGSTLCISLRRSSHLHSGFEEGVTVFMPSAELVFPFGIFPLWAWHTGKVVVFHAIAANLFSEEKKKKKKGMNRVKCTHLFCTCPRKIQQTRKQGSTVDAHKSENHTKRASTHLFNPGFEDDKLEVWLVAEACVCLSVWCLVVFRMTNSSLRFRLSIFPVSCFPVVWMNNSFAHTQTEEEKKSLSFVSSLSFPSFHLFIEISWWLSSHWAKVELLWEGSDTSELPVAFSWLLATSCHAALKLTLNLWRAPPPPPALLSVQLQSCSGWECVFLSKLISCLFESLSSQICRAGRKGKLGS